MRKYLHFLTISALLTTSHGYKMPTILVIDDEAPLRQLIMSALLIKGYSPIEAENGKDGYSNGPETVA